MEQPPENNSGKKIIYKTFKWVSIVLGCLFAIALVIYIGLAIYLDSYLKSRLEKEVRQASNGLYNLNIGYLDFRLDDFSFVADNIVLDTDSSLYQLLQQKKATAPNFYQLSAEKLYISRINVWPLLWGKGIHVPAITLTDPDIYIMAHADSSQAKQKKPVLLHLHRKLENYVPWLTVDSVGVTNGDIQYVLQSDSGKTSFKANNFVLALQNVLVDEDARKDSSRVLYTKNISLEIEEGITITSAPYSFTMQYVSASTATGTQIRDIVLSTDTAQLQQAQKNILLDMRIPLMQIGFLDWRKLFDKEGLYIPAIRIEQPVARLVMPQQKKQPLILHKQVNQLVPWLKIDSIQLNKGNVVYEKQDALKNIRLAIENFDLIFDDVYIDSTAAQNPDRILYSRDIKLAVYDFVRVVSDIYTVRASLFKASTLNGIHIEDLRVQTDKKALRQHPQAFLYEVTVPALSASFTDWGALTESKGLHIPAIRVTRPKARIVARGENKKNKSTSNSLHQMISAYMPWLKIDRVNIQHGDITYVMANKKQSPAIVVNNFFLTGQNILIDSGAAYDNSRFFYTKDIHLEIKDYARLIQKQHQLKIGYLSASTSRGITLKKAYLLTDSSLAEAGQKDPFYQVNVPFMHADFTNWNALLKEKGIHIPLIEIKQPEATIHTYAGAPDTSTNTPSQKRFPQKNLLTLHKNISPYIPWLEVDSIRLTGGELTYTQNNTSDTTRYSAGNIHLTVSDVLIDSAAANDKDRVLYAQNIRLLIKDSIKIATPHYVFVTDSFRASTIEGIQAANLRLFPLVSAILSGKRKQPLFYAAIPELYAGFTDWGRVMQGAGVHIPVIEVKKPAVKMLAPENTASQQTKVSGQNTFSIQKAVTRYVPWLTIDSLNVNKGTFRYVQYPDQVNEFPYAANDVFLTFDNIRIDSAAEETNDRVLYTEDIRFRVGEYQRLFKDSLYAFAVENLQGSTARKTLRLNNLKLKPRYQVEEFFRKGGGQRDVVSVALDQMHVQEINYQELIQNQSIIADFINTDGLTLRIFRDRRNTTPSPNRRLPLEAFRQMETYVRLDSISLEEGYISYTEFPENGREAGTVFFSDITASLLNITNDSLLVSLQNPAVIEGNALLMGAGKINLTMQVPVFNDTNTFQYIGSLGEMDLRKLNPILEKTAFIRIRSGKLDELTAQVDANQDKATGIMCAFYRNFEIEMLPHDPGEEDDLWKDITTFMANKFVINNNNRRRRKSYDFNPGFIEVERQKDKSAINYFWATIRNGIYGSIGYKKAKKIIPFL